MVRAAALTLDWAVLTRQEIRLSRVLVDYFLRSGVRGAGTQDSHHFEEHCGGCDAVFLGDIHLPLRARNDLGASTGECDRFSFSPTANVNQRAILVGIDSTPPRHVSCCQLIPQMQRPHDLFFPSRSVGLLCKSYA